jgi:hypothetical protein
MTLIGYSSYFTKVEQFKGGENNLNVSEVLVNQALNEMEELIGTNE